MRKNKFSKWIERLLVLLPLFYVAITSAYVIFNKNAKDSYSGLSYIEYNPVSYLDDFALGTHYNFNNFNGTYTNSSQLDSGYVVYSNLTNIQTGDASIDRELITSSYAFRFYYTSSQNVIYFVDSNYVTVFSKNILNNSLSFDFVLEGYNRNSLSNNFTFLTEYNFNNFASLNNVMTYSMSEFNNLGFGKLDFTSWFTNIFMNGNTNNVYVSFVNSYLNYFLLVECVYFIPMIIYWFIHFGESIVERFVSKGDNW